MTVRILPGWVPPDALRLAVPLTEKYEGNNYVIHHYDGFEIGTAVSICEELLQSVTMPNPIHIYLYLIDYPHDHSRLDRMGSNNGYTQRTGQLYSIVIFRKLFWPKVLIHELLHVLWMVNQYPIPCETLRWDEALIEAQAVRLAIARHYINESEYKYYIQQTKDTLMRVCGGTKQLRRNQRTPLYEYIYLSENVNKLLNQ